MYQFTAYTLDKKIAKGTIDAVSETMAEEALYQAGYQRILSLREVPPGLSLEKLMPTLFGVRTQDVINFSHQLATLIESGVNIITALQLLEEQTNRASFKRSSLGWSRSFKEGALFPKRSVNTHRHSPIPTAKLLKPASRQETSKPA